MSSFLYRYETYRIPFRRPLPMPWGLWTERRGIIVTLEDENGRQGQGEIAPLPEFGSETDSVAWTFCQKFPSRPRPEDFNQIPDNLPCCRFAFASALLALESPPFLPPQDWPYSYLLPLDEQGLPVLNALPSFPVYKWKIGRREFAAESAELPRILEKLPPNAQLRLDANGALTLKEAVNWLKLCDSLGRIECLEQPLAPSQLVEMRYLAPEFVTPIALDESLNSGKMLERLLDQGWPGLYVLKVAILGAPQTLTPRLQQIPEDKIIYSSALETEIGRRNVLQWVAQWGGPKRALGFGVEAWLGASENDSTSAVS